MIYVTSDLHGYPLDKFKSLLKSADFSENDYCFILGDVIDRGPESIEILKWLLLQPNIELIIGNHEAMLLACSFLFDEITDESLDNLNEDQMAAFNTWIANGGRNTLKELSENDPETVLSIVEYIKDAPLYDTVTVGDKEFLLVHSGLGNFNHDKQLSEYTADEFLWTRPKLSEKYFDDVITIFGHTPTHFYNSENRGKILTTKSWIDIDTGAACGGSPMLLRLDDMKEFYENNSSEDGVVDN